MLRHCNFPFSAACKKDEIIGRIGCQRKIVFPVIYTVNAIADPLPNDASHTYISPGKYE